MQEHAQDEAATNTSLDIPPNVLNAAAAMLDSICDEPTAVCSQTTSPPFAEMELLHFESSDDPGIPQKV